MICVIGGGASGLAYAIMALDKGRQVCVLEKQSRVGRKLLATGNGRCNLTNEDLGAQHFHSSSPRLAQNILAGFTYNDSIEFFQGIGVPCRKQENQRVYPAANRANSVLDAMRLAIFEKGGKIQCDKEVLGLEKGAKGLKVLWQDGHEWFPRVVVACGGAAASPLGGGMGGYNLLERLGHTRTKLYPSIVQIKTETEFVRPLAGIKVEVMARIDARSGTRAERGECLFTEYGLSGPPILQLSRIAAISGGGVVELDFFPHINHDQLLEQLKARYEKFPHRTYEDFFVGLMNRRLSLQIIKRCGIAPNQAAQLSGVAALAEVMKGVKLKVVGTLPMKDAQCTAGGMVLEEWDGHLQSRLVPGLFATGEILDVDGDCGGYNLHWAFATAAAAAARALD